MYCYITGDGGGVGYSVLRDLRSHGAGGGGGGGGSAVPGDGQDRAQSGGGEAEGAQSGQSPQQEVFSEVRICSHLPYRGTNRMVHYEQGAVGVH